MTEMLNQFIHSELNCPIIIQLDQKFALSLNIVQDGILIIH